ncbi:hypothetical protein H257_05011 [Aphanomyces astaci]|uniref:Uncharacterized protein n=1 Tax=Aphanomyces astaci TaxID=112090 RepID=W4GRM7_APHAT|nr:hypothetical protein H257_05011 [Aphanomyces astaci]ETV82352.1 hypothetical protein H257_05011 [Aphanomyces astaci]|eukprot:XP_009828021.1 hypothetical protein H257_05011 [Aphanomyces astaci]
MGWTIEEDERLRSLVHEFGEQQWSVISQHMTSKSPEGHMRNRKQCRERYLNHLSPSLRRDAWTRDENATLRTLVDKFKSDEGKTPWAKIATSLPGRSVDQVKTQWRRLVRQQPSSQQPLDAVTTKTSSQTSPWTSDDNKKLMHLCTSTTSLQPSWLWIASHFPSRTDLQCRQHWTHVLDPALKKGKGTWTDEDDQLLGSLVERFGPSWKHIATNFPGRLGKQCRERYRNHVDPSLTHEPWTLDEDNIVLAAQDPHLEQVVQPT